MADLRDQITLAESLTCNVWSCEDERLPGITLPVGRSRAKAVWRGHWVQGPARVSGYVVMQRYRARGMWWTQNVLLMMQ